MSVHKVGYFADRPCIFSPKGYENTIFKAKERYYFCQDCSAVISHEEILSKNDYEKEITDWLANIYNQFYTGYYPAFD